MKTIKKIAFVELQPRYPHVGSYMICPTYGPILLATILNQKGYESVVYVEGIAKIDQEELDNYDVICFSIQTPAAKKSYPLAQQLKTDKNLIIFGGSHPTFFPDDCISYCDYVIRGEGDDILPNLLQCIEHQSNIKEVRGVSYKDNGTIVHNESASNPMDLSYSANYEVVKNLKYWTTLRRILHKKFLTLPVQSSRGCSNGCSFCAVKDLFGSNYRKRPVSSVIREIMSAQRFTSNIYFVDNNFVGKTDEDLQDTQDLLKTIIKENLSIKASVFITIDIAENKELLTLMKSAGIKVLMIGFESIDRKSLEIYHKKQIRCKMEENIKALIKKDFTILGSFMAGINGEDEYSISNTVSWAIKWGIDQLYYFVLSPYPNMREIVPFERIFLNDWDYGTGTHIYFFPQNTSPSSLQESIIKANRVFYSIQRMGRFFIMLKWKNALNLFLRRILFEKIACSIKQEYIPILKTIEKDLYLNGELLQDKLKTRKIDKIKFWGNPNQIYRK